MICIKLDWFHEVDIKQILKNQILKGELKSWKYLKDTKLYLKLTKFTVKLSIGTNISKRDQQVRFSILKGSPQEEASPAFEKLQ